MQMETGRVYHPGPEKVGGVGLVKSKLAIQISPKFIFDNGENVSPTKFVWDNQHYELTQELVPILESLVDVRKFSLGIHESW